VRIFGLTGGIGSGKSTVARRFEELGIPVVYADRLAREAVAKGSTGLEAIAKEFGEDVIAATGELDRRALGARTFGDKAALAKLNAIVHPRVAALALEAFRAHAEAGKDLVCYEVPLLVENGLMNAFRPVVVVAASEEQQVARAVARDGLSEAEARARIDAQLPLADKIAVADFVIDNSGSLDDLLEATDRTAAAIRSMAATDRET
jgi:dephospho-CoA kinase